MKFSTLLSIYVIIKVNFPSLSLLLYNRVKFSVAAILFDIFRTEKQSGEHENSIQFFNFTPHHLLHTMKSNMKHSLDKPLQNEQPGK